MKREQWHILHKKQQLLYSLYTPADDLWLSAHPPVNSMSYSNIFPFIKTAHLVSELSESMTSGPLCSLQRLLHWLHQRQKGSEEKRVAATRVSLRQRVLGPPHTLHRLDRGGMASVSLIYTQDNGLFGRIIMYKCTISPSRNVVLQIINVSNFSFDCLKKINDLGFL